MTPEENTSQELSSSGAIEFNPHVRQPKPAPAPAPEPKPAEEKELESKAEPKAEPVEKGHPMQRIVLDKVVVNIGVGEAGERLIKAQKVLEMLTDHHKPTNTISRTTNKDLGIREGMPIGCKVTLRGDGALDFLKRAFWVKQNKIASYSFDPRGNFSFGVRDYTDFEGMKYSPDIGIFGMDISASLKRAGYRVSRRKIKKGHVPDRHMITREQGVEFAKRTFELEVIH